MLSITPQARFGPLGLKLVAALKAVEVRIALATGETLVVRTEGPVLLAPLGLPIGLGGGLLGVLIALMALIGLHREFRPLSRLAEALDRIDPGDEAAALPPIRARTRELRSLVAAFERLQARLSTLIHARMALVGGLQHDVRTFAARLRLRVEGIADDHGLSAGRHHLHKAFVDGALHEHARAVGADFASRIEVGKQSRVHGVVEVGIVEHDER